MALTILNKEEFGKKYLSEAWQERVGTDLNPAGEQEGGAPFYETDPEWDGLGDSNGTGLYGGLTDSIRKIDYDEEAAKNSIQEGETIQSSGDKGSVIVDNINGENEETNTLTLQKDRRTTVGESKTETDSITNSFSVETSFGFEVPGVGSSETTIGFETSGTYSLAKGTFENTSEGTTFSTELPITAPAGTAKKGVLLFNEYTTELPFTAIVDVEGKTETFFDDYIPHSRQDRDGEHRNWYNDAGPFFNYINEYETAGEESSLYKANPNNPDAGIVEINDTLEIGTTGNFRTKVFDVTEEEKNKQSGKADLRVLDYSAATGEGVGMSYTLTGSTEKITSTVGDDLLEGSKADEKFDTYGGDDIVFGNGGNDYIEDLKGGKNEFYGQDGDDTLVVTSEQSGNQLLGGEGKDTLVVNAPQSILSGGAGEDSFILGTKGDKAPAHTIIDFEKGTDTIDFSENVNVESFSAIDQEITDKGLVLSSGDTELATLLGNDTELTATSFNFDGFGENEPALEI